jgi:hypothetical protein
MNPKDRRRTLARAFNKIEPLEAPVRYHGGPLDGGFKVFFCGTEPPIQKEIGGHYKLSVKKEYAWCDWDP